jgi:ribosome biogenesis GTPase / thiamine phosphate phosphatase
MKEGLVMRSTGSWYDVLDTENSKVYECRLRGKLKLKGTKVTNPIAVGDKVLFDHENGGQNKGIIKDVTPRDNYIIRKSPHRPVHGHIIAANIDHAILIATLVYPRTSLGFIDRFLVAAESFRIPAAVVFNKKDILDDDLISYYSELKEAYEKIGYPCILISAELEENLGDFKNMLQGKKSLLSGHSGVGKSTILNKIVPGLNLKTAEVSDFAEKGVHTTTFAEMFQIGKDTFVVDTPGIKELGLIDIDKEEISHFFPEMRALFGHCKFYNCTHTHEPGCAVVKAVETGKIAISRYESYLSMLEDEDNRR